MRLAKANRRAEAAVADSSMGCRALCLERSDEVSCVVFGGAKLAESGLLIVDG